MAVASAMESSVRPLLQSHLEKMSQVASALPAGAESEAEAAAVLSGAPSLRAAVDALSARLDGMAGVGSTGGALSAAQEAQLGIALDGFLKKLVEQQDALLAQAEWPAALLKAHSTGHDMLRTLLGLLQEQLTGSAASYAGSVAGTPSRGLNGGSPARNGFQDRGLFGDERRVGDPPASRTGRFGSPRSSAPLARASRSARRARRTPPSARASARAAARASTASARPGPPTAARSGCRSESGKQHWTRVCQCMCSQDARESNPTLHIAHAAPTHGACTLHTTYSCTPLTPPWRRRPRARATSSCSWPTATW